MLGIIGGSGLTELKGLEISEHKQVETPYGEPSSELILGTLAGGDVVFLARHGSRHQWPPHRINYRANIHALKQLGVTDIIAVNAVGGIASCLQAEALVVPHQLLDYTWGRESTFSDENQVSHVDFSYPYDESLRQRLLQAAELQGLKIHAAAVHGITQGPRLETAAEINRMEQDGCDIVGMTGMPEASLARELEIRYACLALVVNMAAGRSEKLITMVDINKLLNSGMEHVRAILRFCF